MSKAMLCVQASGRVAEAVLCHHVASWLTLSADGNFFGLFEKLFDVIFSFDFEFILVLYS